MVRAFVCAFLVWVTAAAAGAQQAPRPVDETTISQSRVYDRSTNHWHFIGQVELTSGDSQIFADDIEAWLNENRVVASGNVLFVQGNNRIAADRAVFNSKTRLGTFYHAFGIANIQPPRQTAAAGGVVAPQLSGQDTDVYFFGDEVEKIGPKKYNITNGGFSTCVQPTPRWNLSAKTIVLNIDHYTRLSQALLKVKGVPMLYVPWLYYPTKDEQRATGFLLPTIGLTSLYGQSIHNGFFWAINRSQDATIKHDWFSKGAQGIGSEYRYNMGRGSDGTITAHLLDQKQITYLLSDGASSSQPATRSYNIVGSATQPLPWNLRARGRVDYFSSLQTMQQFNTNIYDASRSQRSFSGNVIGSWRTYSLNATVDRSETFYNTTDSAVNGGAPRLAVNRNERPLRLGWPVYLSVGSEFAHLIRQSNTSAVSFDTGLSRADVLPQIRYPFKKWAWMTVNSTFSWRETFYTRSLDPNTIDPLTNRATVVEDSLNRQYFQLQSQIVGPVFNRVWDTPNNGYAERFKHTIEPSLTITRVSPIANFDRILQTDGSDSLRGNQTGFNYGLTNRFYAKRKIGTLSQSQEIATVSITQTYYTDPLQSQYDRQYTTTQIGGPSSKFTPVLLSVRATPVREVDGTLRAEFDSRTRSLRTLSVTGNHNLTARLQTSVTWSRRFFIKDLPGYNDSNFLDHYLSLSTNAHTRDNRFGTIYSFNYNILRSAMLQQRVMGFYNAQCCGLAFDYSTYNSGFSTFPANHKFFISFTLAGLGNFSPFNGALSGVPR
jgi:LPS-assembly protein